MARSRHNKRMPLLPVTPASHHCGEAVAEFHKVIDYPGIVVNEPSVHYLISNSDEPKANPVTPPRRKPHYENYSRSRKTWTPKFHSRIQQKTRKQSCNIIRSWSR